jgi:hypothetical protein
VQRRPAKNGSHALCGRRPSETRENSPDNLGPGRLSVIPHGLKVGPLGVSDLSCRRGSNGRARVSEKRNCGDAPGRNPSSFPSPSTRRVSGGERGRGRNGDGGAAASPFAGVRVHHRVSAPPSSGLPRCSMPSRVALATVADEGRTRLWVEVPTTPSTSSSWVGAEEKVSPPPLSPTSFARVRVFPFPLFVFLIPTLIYASRLGSDAIVEFGIATA